VHEIKYDGYRMMLIREQDRLRLISRFGHDWVRRFPLIAAAALKCSTTGSTVLSLSSSTMPTTRLSGTAQGPGGRGIPRRLIGDGRAE
jgi:hypothetical protein